MTNKKYDLLKTDHPRLFRIIALKDFPGVRKGQLGGRVESEDNLSHEGFCWIYDNGIVIEKARVYDNAIITDNAFVKGNARVYDDARVSDEALIAGNAKVFECSRVKGFAILEGFAKASGNSIITEYALVKDFASVDGNARVLGNSEVSDWDRIKYGFIRNNTSIENRLYSQLNILLQPDQKELILYKPVDEHICNIFDPCQSYYIGQLVYPGKDEQSRLLGDGLFVSHPSYWTRHYSNTRPQVLLECKVNIEDIIEVKYGAVNVKKLKIINIRKF